MNQSKPAPLHADAVHSQAFTGNLQRASLLPGEIAVRPPISQEIRAAAGTGGYPQPSSPIIYRRHLVHMSWPHRDGSHMTRGVERPWWHWPVITSLVVLVVYMLILVTSDSSAGDNISLMLHQLI